MHVQERCGGRCLKHYKNLFRSELWVKNGDNPWAIVACNSLYTYINANQLRFPVWHSYLHRPKTLLVVCTLGCKLFAGFAQFPQIEQTSVQNYLIIWFFSYKSRCGLFCWKAVIILNYKDDKVQNSPSWIKLSMNTPFSFTSPPCKLEMTAEISLNVSYWTRVFKKQQQDDTVDLPSTYFGMQASKELSWVLGMIWIF